MSKPYKIFLFCFVLLVGTYTLHWFCLRAIYRVEEFKVEAFDYEECYTKSHGKGSYDIIIASGSKKYYFLPSEAMLPEGFTTDYVYEQLMQSHTALVWYDDGDEKKDIMGIKTDRLNIPPEYGLNFHKSERRALIYGNISLWLLVLLNFWAFRKP